MKFPLLSIGFIGGVGVVEVTFVSAELLGENGDDMVAVVDLVIEPMEDFEDNYVGDGVVVDAVDYVVVGGAGVVGAWPVWYTENGQVFYYNDYACL
ncbi:hypothetical protein QCA50_016801 [Cerrena zonata]|uniref:Uncharacterized protein n=1 Tax=Cerrena zonata TaxID=2478898 RepID=A0AAW0FHK3_9APHY